MKKTVVLILTVFLLMLSMGTFTLADTESDNGLAQAITAAKSKITIPAVYSDFSYSMIERNNEEIWQLTWKKENNSYIEICVDGSGRLHSYYTYEAGYNYSEKVRVPKITKEKAESIAQAAIKKLVPEAAGKLVLNSSSAYTGSAVYTFHYNRVENGISFTADTVAVNVNYLTGKLESLEINWHYDLTFPSPDGALSKDQAIALFQKAVSVDLEYQLSSDGAKGADYAYLVYTSPDGQKSIDPFTGEVYTEDYGWDEKNEGRGNAADQAASKSISNSFTDAEAAKIAATENLISAAKADEILRANQCLPLDTGFSLVSKNLNPSYSDEDTYVWSLDYTGPVTKGNFNAASAYAELDAKTGEILYFSYYDDKTDSGNTKYNQTTAQNTAEKFLKANSSAKFAKTVLSNEPAFIYAEDGKTPVTYDFNYVRANEGVKFAADYLSVTVDAYSGYVTNYNTNWHPNITFQKTQGIISENDALTKILEQCGLNLRYQLYTTYYYDQEESKAGTAGTADASATIIGPPGADIPSADSARLVYAPEPGTQLAVRADNGEMIGSNGDSSQSEEVISYSDISGSWIEGQAKLLAAIGIGFDGGKLYPEKAIKQKEFLYLLDKTTENYLPFYKISLLSNTDNSDYIYEEMLARGIIKKAEVKPDATITRMEAIRFIIRAAGYEKAAQIEGIYKTSFADNASIAAADKGYCALAYGLGIIGGDAGGGLHPGQTLTREQALGMIYNYLQF